MSPLSENFMPTRRPLPTVVAVTLFALAAALVSAADAATLKPYRSEAEFTEALQRWTTQSQRLQGERRREAGTTWRRPRPPRQR
jgi:hypothetical protein